MFDGAENNTTARRMSEGYMGNDLSASTQSWMTDYMNSPLYKKLYEQELAKTQNKNINQEFDTSVYSPLKNVPKDPIQTAQTLDEAIAAGDNEYINDLYDNAPEGMSWLESATTVFKEIVKGVGLVGKVSPQLAPVGAVVGAGKGIMDVFSENKQALTDYFKEQGLDGEDASKLVEAYGNRLETAATVYDRDPNREPANDHSAVNNILSLAGGGSESLPAGVTTIGQVNEQTISGMSWDQKMQAYDMSSIHTAIQGISDVDTDIQYQHTLADLSGIGLDPAEKEMLDTQRDLAIDRAIGEIESTFETEGESMVAQQIHNLGTNALGGTIGQSFVKRWQEREAQTKTDALSGIESQYLSASQSALNNQKQRQMDLWGKEYDSDVKQSELDLDKAKATASVQYNWDQSYLDRLATLRGQDIQAEQGNLDRLLKERMGNQEIGAWEDANDSAAWGGIIGAATSDGGWLDDISDWFS